MICIPFFRHYFWIHNNVIFGCIIKFSTFSLKKRQKNLKLFVFVDKNKRKSLNLYGSSTMFLYILVHKSTKKFKKKDFFSLQFLGFKNF